MEDQKKAPRLKVVMRSENDYQLCAARLRAIADPDRLQIINCLFGGPKNVSELASELGQEVVKVSHHLGVLRHANVVRTARHGKFVVYRLDPEIAAAKENAGNVETLDLGCCRLDLPKPPTKRKRKLSTARHNGTAHQSDSTG